MRSKLKAYFAMLAQLEKILFLQFHVTQTDTQFSVISSSSPSPGDIHINFTV